MKMEKKQQKIVSSSSHHLSLDVFLFIFWLLFTGLIFGLFSLDILSIYSLLVGVISVIIVSYISHNFIFISDKKKWDEKVNIYDQIKHWCFLSTHLFIYLFKSNLSFFRQTITGNINPKIVDIPVNLQKESQVTLLSSMITITPGTLVLKTKKIPTGYSLTIHFSYLKTSEIEESVGSTIKKWERSIRRVI